MTNNQLRDISSSATYLFWRGSDYRFIISQILDFEESILSDEIKQMIINRNYIYNLGLRNKFPIQEFMDNIYKIIDEYIQVYISDRVYWSIENYGINYTNNFQNWITHYCKIKQLLQQFLLGCEKYNFESNSAVEEIYLLPNIISDTEFIMFSRIIYQSDFRFSHFMNEYNKIQKFNNKQDWFNFIDFI